MRLSTTSGIMMPFLVGKAGPGGNDRVSGRNFAAGPGFGFSRHADSVRDDGCLVPAEVAAAQDLDFGAKG